MFFTWFGIFFLLCRCFTSQFFFLLFFFFWSSKHTHYTRNEHSTMTACVRCVYRWGKKNYTFFCSTFSSSALYFVSVFCQCVNVLVFSDTCIQLRMKCVIIIRMKSSNMYWAKIEIVCVWIAHIVAILHVFLFFILHVCECMHFQLAATSCSQNMN